nr:hypothetical protein Iba_chr10bCG10300 [Ipomoea batatas]
MIGIWSFEKRDSGEDPWLIKVKEVEVRDTGVVAGLEEGMKEVVKGIYIRVRIGPRGYVNYTSHIPMTIRSGGLMMGLWGTGLVFLVRAKPNNQEWYKIGPAEELCKLGS